jgi:carboxymethylenebutenolidase
VIFYMDGLGIRPSLLEMGQRLADGGYLVLLPDLYYRFGPYTPLDPKALAQSGTVMEAIGPMFATTGPHKAVADTAGFLAWLDTRRDVRGEGVGITGYCMGGAMTLTVAGEHPQRIAAAASFHGGGLVIDQPDSPHLSARKAKGQLYIAHAVQDPYCPAEMIVALDTALDEAGVDYRSEVYEGALHGWTVPDAPPYDHEAAERHWDALFALLKGAL